MEVAVRKMHCDEILKQEATSILQPGIPHPVLAARNLPALKFKPVMRAPVALAMVTIGPPTPHPISATSMLGWRRRRRPMPSSCRRCEAARVSPRRRSEKWKD